MTCARRTIGWPLGVAATMLFVAGCASHADPNERVTGSRGTLVRYSSRQATIDLTSAERSALERMRDRVFAGKTPAQAMQAVAAALKMDGYAPVTVDAESQIVEGGHGEVLVAKWREVLRGVLKSKVGALPAKPDHQYTAALVSVRDDGHGGTIVRARFDRTVWDSNGDAKTKTVVASADYDAFFERVGRALNGERPAATPAQRNTEVRSPAPAATPTADRSP